MTNVETAETADLSFSATTAAIVSFFEVKPSKKKEKKQQRQPLNDEMDVQLDSVYPEHKSVSYTQFGPISGKGRHREESQYMDFQDVYPDRQEMSSLATPTVSGKQPSLQGASKTLKTPASNKALDSALPMPKFGSKMPGNGEKMDIGGYNPLRSKLKSPTTTPNMNLLPSFQGEHVKKPAPMNNAYRDSIIESRKQLRKTDPAGEHNPLSYKGSRMNAIRTNANRVGETSGFGPGGSSSSSRKVGGRDAGVAAFYNSTSQDDPPLRHEIPIVDIFKSVNVTQMTGLSQGIKFRLSKLKFEARSGDK